MVGYFGTANKWIMCHFLCEKVFVIPEFSSVTMSRSTKDKEVGKTLEQVTEAELEIDPDLLSGTPDDILARARLLDSETKILKNECMLLSQEIRSTKERIKDNVEKIKMNKQLPYLVGHVVEVCAVFVSTLTCRSWTLHRLMEKRRKGPMLTWMPIVRASVVLSRHPLVRYSFFLLLLNFY